jgi:hypothetical protein
LMHSAFNASSRFIGPFLGSTPTRSRPSAEMLLAFAYLTAAGVVVLYTRGRLRSAVSQVDTLRK